MRTGAKLPKLWPNWILSGSRGRRGNPCTAVCTCSFESSSSIELPHPPPPAGAPGMSYTGWGSVRMLGRGHGRIQPFLKRPETAETHAIPPLWCGMVRGQSTKREAGSRVLTFSVHSNEHVHTAVHTRVHTAVRARFSPSASTTRVVEAEGETRARPCAHAHSSHRLRSNCRTLRRQQGLPACRTQAGGRFECSAADTAVSSRF